MIEIINGTFGYQQKRKKGEKIVSKITPITAADGPQSFDKELEARLVREGVARYVTPEKVVAEKTPPPPGSKGYNMDTSATVLKEIAKGIGVKFPFGTSKVEMVAALDEAYAKIEAGLGQLKGLDTPPAGDPGQVDEILPEPDGDNEDGEDDTGYQDAEEPDGEDDGEDDGSPPPDLSAATPS